MEDVSSRIAIDLLFRLSPRLTHSLPFSYRHRLLRRAWRSWSYHEGLLRSKWDPLSAGIEPSRSELFLSLDVFSPTNLADLSSLAQFMIDVVSGSLSKGRDWSAVWLDSPEHVAVTKEIEELDAACAAAPPSFIEDGKTYAVSQWTQIMIVSKRSRWARVHFILTFVSFTDPSSRSSSSSVSMFRSVDYLQGKLRLHIGTSSSTMQSPCLDSTLTRFLLFSRFRRNRATQRSQLPATRQLGHIAAGPNVHRLSRNV